MSPAGLIDSVFFLNQVFENEPSLVHLDTAALGSLQAFQHLHGN